MSAARFFGDAHLPGMNFVPEDQELVELYLLPRVRGQPDPFPGLIIEDDRAANTQPWKFFGRHHLPQKDNLPAFFYVRTNEVRPDARPVRGCDGGGTWKSQKREKDDNHVLRVGGGEIRWSKHNLNFTMGRGSIGWVMYEYSIPDHPSVKVCRISFSGHGHKRTRVPDGYGDDCSLVGEPAPKRARVVAAARGDSASAASSSGRTTTTAFVQDSGAAQAFLENQDPSQNLSEEEIENMVEELTYAQPEWTCEVEPYYPYQQQQMGQKVDDQGAVPRMDDSSLAGEPAAMQPPCFFTADNNISGSSASASWTNTTSSDQEYLQQTSQDQEAETAEMTYADGQLGLAPPTMEQQQVDQLPAAAQMSEDEEAEAMVAEMTDPSMELVMMEQRVDLEPVAAQMSEDEEAAAMVPEMIDPSMVPLVADQEQPSCTFDVASYTDLLLEGSRCVPTNVTGVATGAQGVFTFQGIDYCY